MFAGNSGAKSSKHTLASMLPELAGASDALEVEIQNLQREEAALVESITRIVGNLSDLRYGKLGNTRLRDDVLDSLDSLQETCEGKS